MKFTAVLVLALVALASANNVKKTQNRAAKIANAAVNKALAKAQGLVRQYGIKGANGRPLNLKANYAKAVTAAKKQANSQEAKDAAAEAEKRAKEAQKKVQEIQRNYEKKLRKRFR